MYIEPQTNIKILKDVPLDNSYEHTIWFGSADSQLTYFNSKVKYNLNSLTYQRVNRGYARVGMPAENLYDCNYMMFQNTAFGNKRFYAFIQSVEYVNNECSTINFEIDVMQTWLFDWDPQYCYIERMHTTTDYIGEHLAPEPVEIGEYVFNTYDALFDLTEMAIIVAVLNLNDAVYGQMVDGIYSGATLYSFTSVQSGLVDNLINDFAQQPSNVVGIYMAPASFLASISDSTDWHDHRVGLTFALPDATDLPKLTEGSNLDGHTARNLKLLSYPYTMFSVNNGGQANLNLRYEFFQYGKPQFGISGTISQPVQVNLWPVNYKGVEGTGTTKRKYNPEALQINNFPICSWATDSYQAWVAQNSLPLMVNTGTKLALGAGGIVTGAAAGAAAGGLVGAGVGAAAGAAQALTSSFSAIKDAMLQNYRASIAGDILNGNLQNGGAAMAAGEMQFYGGRLTVNFQMAEIIDDFFDFFGYSIMEKEIPTFNNRPNWTYVKTTGAVLTGSVPADDINKIIQILDKGITWWNNGDNVGNYSLGNLATERGQRPLG